MKNSNKILASLFTFVLVCEVTFMCMLKANLVPYKVSATPTGLTDLEELHTIRGTDAFRFSLSIGTRNLMELEGKSELLDRVETKYENGVLSLGMNTDKDKSHEIHARVRINDIERIDLSGDSRLMLYDTLNLDTLEITMSGNTTANLELDVEYLNVNLRGNAKLFLNGKVDSLILTAEGESIFDGGWLVVQDAEAHVSGESSTTIQASKSIKGSRKGTALLDYTGSPSSVSIEHQEMNSLPPDE